MRADIRTFETLQNQQNARIGFTGMGVFNDTAIKNTKFYREYKEIKPEELPDTHPDKTWMLRINRIEQEIGFAFMNTLREINESNKTESEVEQGVSRAIIGENLKDSLNDLITEYLTETEGLRNDRAIRSIAESPYLRAHQNR